VVEPWLNHGFGSTIWSIVVNHGQTITMVNHGQPWLTMVDHTQKNMVHPWYILVGMLGFEVKIIGVESKALCLCPRVRGLGLELKF